MARCSRLLAGAASIGVLLISARATQFLNAQEAQPPKRETIGEVLGKPVYRDEIRTGEDVLLRDELHRLFTRPVLENYRQVHKADVEVTEKEIAAAAVVLQKRIDERRKELEPGNRDQLKSVQDRLAAGGLSDKEQDELEIRKTSLQIQLLTQPELKERLQVVEGQLGDSELPQRDQRKLATEKGMLEAALGPQGRMLATFMLPNWKFQRHLYDQYGGGRILWQQAGLEAFDAMRKWLEAHEEKGDFRITDPKLRSAFYEYWTTMNHGAFLTSDRERIRSEFLEPDWAPKPPPQP